MAGLVSRVCHGGGGGGPNMPQWTVRGDHNLGGRGGGDRCSTTLSLNSAY